MLALSSPIKLQAQLNLPRNATRAGGIRPGRRDNGKVLRVRELQTPEAIREIRMVQEIEELAAEFQMRALGGGELLEQGKVQVVIPRTVHLSILTAQGGVIGLANRRSHGRIAESRGVEKLVDAMRSGMRIKILTRHHKGGTAKIGGSGGRASHGKRESILESEDPLGAPSANRLVDETGSVAGEAVTLADGDLPDPAGTKDIGNIVAAIPIIAFKSKSREQWSASEIILADTKDILVVRFAYRTCVINEQVQALAESAL